MAMLFGLLVSTLFPIVFAQAKNYSLSPEGAEQASKLYGEFSSQLNETESTSHTTGHSTNHTMERGRTQSTRESSDLGEKNQKTRAFWDHTDGIRDLTTTMSHAESNKSLRDASSSQKPTVPPPSTKGHQIRIINLGLDTVPTNFLTTWMNNVFIQLRLDPSQIENTFVHCELTTFVVGGYNDYANVTVDQLKEPYDGNFTLTFSKKSEPDEIIVDNVMLLNTGVSMGSTNTLICRFEGNAPFKPLVITMHFILQKGPYIRNLPFFKMSGTLPYVTSPGFNDNREYPNNYDGEFLLKITDGESLIVSFSQFLIHYSDKCLLDYVLLTEVSKNKTETLCGGPMIRLRVFHSSLRIFLHTDRRHTSTGFKLMFAVLPRSMEPVYLTRNVLNCSVAHFHLFAPLVMCNLLKECEGGEDERNCTYHSKECGDDNIDAGTKCHRLVRSPQSISWLEAQNDCSRHGQNLITFTTAEEYDHFRHLLSYVAKNVNFNYIGIQTGSWSHAPSVMKLYDNLWRWVSGGTAFFFLNSGKHRHPTCIYYDTILRMFARTKCAEKRQMDYFCEFEKRVTVPELATMAELNDRLLSVRGNVTWKASVVQCPLGHVTRDFQACDSRADCFAVDSLKLCKAHTVKVPMFLCQQTREAIHYSFVCDHKQHCSDNSDEDFCSYPPCAFDLGFLTCRNGQCFRKHQLCDKKINCYDGSDEPCTIAHNYIYFQGSYFTTFPTFPPGSVYLDGAGSYSVEKLESNRCPPTHFACPNFYCLPVYLRCNGIEDCPGHEDEAGCDSNTCPGFYRCRGSKVCLHADNVCDGVPQCPEQDDELLCDLSCPDQCHCQGLAFVCSTSFSASSYPALRYLDASGSGMTPRDFTDNMHLVHLRMSFSGINKLPTNIAFPNLRVLDLSWNIQTHLDMESFRSMKNLRDLILTGNPLIYFIDSGPLEADVTKIVTIDLSQTNMEVLNTSAFRRSPDIKVLNTSWSKVTVISEEGFQFTPKLEIFDTKGCPLTRFPNELLSNLHYLKYVNTNNFKLCCEAFLPARFNLKNCHAVQNSLASCEDLLMSTVFRVFLWIFASLSLLGNFGCFVGRLRLSTEGKALSSFNIFVTSLSIADFFMGVYLAIVGSADRIYQGVYVFRDTEWRNSTACKIAGFMSLLSSEVSALMICIITLDRFLVLRFPFSRLRFSSKSALITCGFLWLVGVVFASVPLLPMTSHWEFYSQTGLCVPLPFASRDGFPGYDYSFSVMILLNLVLFLLIAVGQSMVFWSVRTNSMSLAHNKSNDAIIARRLIIIVMSDFLCWFPIGLLGVMSATGTSIPGEVNVAMAIFVLPFNSALNPFMYTFNVLMEKRTRLQEARLLKRLECRLQTELSEDTALSYINNH